MKKGSKKSTKGMKPEDEMPVSKAKKGNKKSKKK